jgi:hypothetical protein
MLLYDGLAVMHMPGLAVNRARQAIPGGERKSDPKDARVIADEVRISTRQAHFPVGQIRQFCASPFLSIMSRVFAMSMLRGIPRGKIRP